MQARTPIASWRPRPALGAAVALRHERPNAPHRAHYYEHHWPDLAPNDLIERPGRWVALWITVAVVGVVGLVSSPIVGDETPFVISINVALLALLLVAHGCNAVRARRRRSVLLTPVLAGAVTLGVLHVLGRSGVQMVDILSLAFLAWIPIAAADVVAPGRTYLARRHPHG